MFSDSKFIESTFQNCLFINCDFMESEFQKIIFEKCQFQTNENGSTCLQDANFLSCHFDQTLFTDWAPLDLCGALIINSRFSTPNQSIGFEGVFCAFEVVYSDKGINKMLTRAFAKLIPPSFQVESKIPKYSESTSGIPNNFEVLQFTTIFFMLTTILTYCLA